MLFLIFSGEIEEVGAQRYQKISPSIHETHFEEDIDLPTTVLHHPGIYIGCTIFKNQSSVCLQIYLIINWMILIFCFFYRSTL